MFNWIRDTLQSSTPVDDNHSRKLGTIEPERTQMNISSIDQQPLLPLTSSFHQRRQPLPQHTASLKSSDKISQGIKHVWLI
ncbi:unnamed protein product [Didymodactylos carnosus]|uniref:Uncharacterized protein n=1 Tax=Didymodactylos carnosus TaxID=1234261 RepID=A0A814EE23_9BILA|nr:unnamed protein product [Didymodactylos carnosus]CAF0969663.1 unnamed protein product [Didymodactylos carnosus]CAF3493558.1 unnamed protein product [Didymodactylos carnosus]CAF3742835.1 unnamed protein product [Didymodactylos carnosus]